jgi:hypothetical protein
MFRPVPDAGTLVPPLLRLMRNEETPRSVGLLSVVVSSTVVVVGAFWIAVWPLVGFAAACEGSGVVAGADDPPPPMHMSAP